MTKQKSDQLRLILSVTIFVAVTLSAIQVMSQKPMILLEKFAFGLGWIEVIILIGYGGFVAHKMSDAANTSKWRVRFWSVFSIVFFLQLILGISGISECLMTGKLHFPIPAMIIAGPIYRAEASVMTIIFLSSILLAGPAWCSQLCYFGAFDALLAKGKTSRKPLKNKAFIKHTILAGVIIVAIIYRIIGLKGWIPTISILIFGIIGIIIMFFASSRERKMVHCTLYCPIGTVVNYLKVISPFRFTISTSCTSCMACTTSCKYDALTAVDIHNLKPGNTCTLCGDCVNSCHASSLQYKLGKMSPEKARMIYLFITISMHVIFIGLARL